MSELNGVKIPADQPRPIGAPEDLINEVHRLGHENHYKRVRLDRGKDDVSGAWYEVGFAGGEVRIRWSHVGTADFKVSSADADSIRVIGSSMRMNINEAAKATAHLEEM